MILDQSFDLVPVAQLSPHPANPRRGDVDRIAESIDVNSFYGALIVQRSTGHVLAGNHRLMAAKQQGLAEVPVLWVDVDDEAAMRILLADNRTNDVATYDEQELTALLRDLDLTDAGLAGTGYSAEDLLALTESGKEELPPVEPPAVSAPEPPVEPVTKPGDVWMLGPHRIICGSSQDYDTVVKLLDGRSVNVAFTSPPYADRREYDASSGFRPIPPDEYVEWFEDVQANVRAVLADDGSWFVNIKAGVTPEGLDTELYVLDLVIAHVRRWGWHWATEFCWERNGVPKSVTRRFKNQFEPVYQFAKGQWKMRPDAVRHWSENVPVAGGPGVGDTSWANAQGGNGSMFGARKRKNGTAKMISDVQGTSHDAGEYIKAGMAYPGNRLPTFAGSHEAVGHTAAFPVGLPAWFIKAYSDEGDVIFDPFMGSGSTLMAAHQEARVAFGTEISPAYCDVICRRFQQHTGTKPILQATGEPHDFTT